jgi:hypothetical protein
MKVSSASYGQLKGCYWTIPDIYSRTTKEGDKDYIVRASLSPNMDLELHKSLLKFVKKHKHAISRPSTQRLLILTANIAKEKEEP